MKTLVRALVGILVVCIAVTACAEGLLPRLGDIFVIDMPSLASVIERMPDREEQLDGGGLRQLYSGVSEQDIDRFSEYITGWECELQEYHVSGSEMTVTIEKDGQTFTLIYDNAARTAKLEYSSGTRCEVWIDPIAAAREANSKALRTVGGTVTFGNYEQDNNTSNGPEPIEWIVLDVQGNRSLLVSKYGLDAKPYNNTKYENTTWEQCTLRTWLNGEFLKTAFSEAEQGAILTTAVDNSKAQGYSGYSTNGGNNTQDKIFLLSYAEAWKYFGSDAARQCKPTAYAVAQRAYQSSGNCWWWLRSPGDYQDAAADVSPGGSRDFYVNFSNEAVRPALWVNPESIL